MAISVNMNEREIIIPENEGFSPEVKLLKKYIQFEASVACDLAKAGLNEDSTSALDIMQNLNSYAEKFDLTEKDILSLEKDNEKIDLEIEKLKKKKEIQENHIKELAEEVVSQRTKLKEKESIFHTTYEAISSNIAKDIEEIKIQL